MKNTETSLTAGNGVPVTWHLPSLGALAALLSALFVVPAHSQTPLADQPIFSTQAVPGNVVLPVSVEWPTVQRVAHTDAYSSAATFLGYFDPNKCYTYTYSASDTAARPTVAGQVSHFQPAGQATARTCSGQWSGNFLNWAATPTIDPFRWALTGGFRIVDTTTTTILEKAWSSSQGGLYPNRSISGAAVAGATPFNWGTVNIRIHNLGNRMRFTGTGNLGDATATVYDGVGVVAGTVYEAYVRAKVCDPGAAAGGVETNCVQYGANWKPEGLLQQYSNRMRFSIFGYLNDATRPRDGGVLRARQKFVGPTRPVAGAPPASNAEAEWDAATGIFVANPNTVDAAATNAEFSPSASVVNSGVMNYLNKFGEIDPTAAYTYKSFDPVSELYYAAVRYLKNLGNVPEYSSMATATDPAQRTTWIDGFPVITNWEDPIQYSCQRNFILGIGDIYTHVDKNLPGATGTTLEPGKPAAVSADTTVDSVVATNKVFQLQGLAAPNNDNYSGRNNSAGIAGLAYDSHTRDIRPDLTGRQTIDTYWVDVLEAPFVANNQFYLAAKFGGFKVPQVYDPYTRVDALPLDWWSTTGDTVGTQSRPDNYYTGGRPDQMVAGLTAAFANIASQLRGFTTSFSTSLPQVAVAGNGSYSAQYDASTWTGEITASELEFNAGTGAPSTTERWKLTDRLAAQLAGTGWDTGRRVVTWNGTTGAAFRYASLTTAQRSALNTSYRAGDDASSYVDYLRGDRSQEQASTVVGSSRAYRTRTALLGDIVGSRARPIGPPAAPFSAAANPGYAAFRTTWANRPTVVYFGANDGMLHAINGALTGASAGNEIFAYVPSATYLGPTLPTPTPNTNGLAGLGNPSFAHYNYVNATPNVFDIDFGRTDGGSGTNWRSVLIGGLGKGGRSYFAIDVTDPSTMDSEGAVAARVLWEFSDPDLGFTFGEPAVIKTRKYGWVAILPSGYNNASGIGYFFIINPRTGALLEKISTGVGSLAASAGLAHVNTYVLDRTDGTADAAYAGDLLGNIWRLDLTSTAVGGYPAPTRLAVLTNAAGQAQPVTTRPLIEIQPSTGVRSVLVGTGRLLDPTDTASTQAQGFYSISDGIGSRFNRAANLPTGVAFPIVRNNLVNNTDLLTGVVTPPAASMGWYVDLGTNAAGLAWRNVSDPTTFSGIVGFVSTLPNGDVCNPSGQSRIYGVNFGTGQSVLTNADGSTLVAYAESSSVVTDLRFFSVAGTPRLIAGNELGELRSIPGRFATGTTLRRLNWRELPIVQ